MVAKTDATFSSGAFLESPVGETTVKKPRESSVQDGEMKCYLDETGESPPQTSALEPSAEGAMDAAEDLGPISHLPEDCNNNNMEGKDEKKKKKKGFRPAPELQSFTLVEFVPATMGLHCSELRYYFPNLVSRSSRGGTKCSSGHSGWQCWDDDGRLELLADEWDENVHKARRCSPSGPSRRPKRGDKTPRAQRQVRGKPFRSGDVLRNTGGNPTKTVRVKHDLSNRNAVRESNLADAAAAKRANTETRLKALKLHRRGPPKNLPVPRDNNSPCCTRPNDSRKQIAKPVKYELKESDVSQHAASEEEAALLKILALIQHRDILPEDYDLLLRLDEKVSKRTMGSIRLRNLRTRLLTDADLADIMMNSEFAGGRCAVCMECYYVNQVVKWLPCGHVFHNNCIDMWLGNAGSICPLDGLEV